MPGRPDKRPEVIAAFVAAEIMQHVASRQTAPAAPIGQTNARVSSGPASSSQRRNDTRLVREPIMPT